MYTRASSPLETLRHAKMTFDAPSLTMCFAASRPSPVFAPVIITVSPANDAVGTGIDTVTWLRRRPTTSDIEGPDMVFECRVGPGIKLNIYQEPK